MKIEILDDAATREIDEQRNVSKILQRFSFPLADGARWVPTAARPLLDNQIARIEAKVQKRVRELVGSDAGQFAASRRQQIEEALNGVYKEFHVAGGVGASVVETVIKDAAGRIDRALGARFLPQLSYNDVWFDPSLASEYASPWPQARNLLMAVAVYFRKAVTSQFFFLGIDVAEEELLGAMDVCGDWIAKDPWRPAVRVRAKAELKGLEEIGASGLDARDQCQRILAIIEGAPKCLAAPSPREPPNCEEPRREALRQNLRIKVTHDEEKIDRLIEIERSELKRKGQLDATVEDLMERAIERWERENR